MIERLRSFAILRFLFDLIGTLSSLVFVAMLSKFGLSRNLPKLHPNCAILGNGPSLRSSLLASEEYISSCDVIVTNDFPVTPEFYKLKPRFYLLIDTAFFKTSNGKIVYPRTLAICNALESVDWKIFVFLPKKYKSVFDSCITNPNVTFHYFNLTPCDGFDWVRFRFFSRGLAMPYVNNVLIPALILSINSDYRNIFIYGADHNWTSFFTLDDANRLCMSGQHFFSGGNDKPKIWWKNEKNSLLVHEALYALSLTFKGYHVIARYAKKKGVNIVNCTNMSLIDAFPKNIVGNGEGLN